MTRLLATNTGLARAVCAVNCNRRALAGLIAIGSTPSLPLSIARSAPLHTWPAYRDAIDKLVVNVAWRALIIELTNAGTSIELVWGSNDRIGDPAFAREFPRASVEVIEGAGHHLPLTNGKRLAARFAEIAP